MKNRIPRRSIQSAPPPPPNPSLSWKDSPVVVGALAAASTLGLCILILEKVILPLQQSSLQNQVQRQSQELAAMEKEATGTKWEFERRGKVIDQLNIELKDVRDQLAAQKLKVAESNIQALFSSGTAYPLGLHTVRIGSLEQDVVNAFPQGSIEDLLGDGSAYRVDVEHPVFQSILISMNYDRSTKLNTVESISYHKKYNLNVRSEFLREKLTEAFGQPKQHGTDLFRWRTPSLEDVFMRSPNEMEVALRTQEPAWWGYSLKAPVPIGPKKAMNPR